MPVARIYTRVPEETTELGERLRARGYTVEIVDPAAFHVTPADLEIRLDRLKTDEAFAAAARFGREHDAEIFVAAGVVVDDAALNAARGITVERGNVLVDGLKRLISPFRRLGAEAHATRAEKRQMVIEQETAREAERQRRAEQKATEFAHREAVARLEAEQRGRSEREEEERRAAIVVREREEAARRQAEELRKQAELEASEREAVLLAQRQETQRQQEEARRQEEEQRRQHAEAAARLAAEQEAETRRRQEEAALAAAAALAVAAKPMAETTAAEAALPAAEAQRPAAPPVTPPTPTPTPAPVTPAPRPRVAQTRYVARERNGARTTKRAFVAAACIAVLAAVGWGAYENRTPASPLSNADRVRGGAIQQDVPFGAATIKSSVPPVHSQVVPPPVGARPASPQAQPAASKPAATSKPSATQPRRARDMVAEDQVIYHGVPKKSNSRAAAQPAPVKKISDMN